MKGVGRERMKGREVEVHGHMVHIYNPLQVAQSRGEPPQAANPYRLTLWRPAGFCSPRTH